MRIYARFCVNLELSVYVGTDISSIIRCMMSHCQVPDIINFKDEFSPQEKGKNSEFHSKFKSLWKKKS